MIDVEKLVKEVRPFFPKLNELSIFQEEAVVDMIKECFNKTNADAISSVAKMNVRKLIIGRTIMASATMPAVMSLIFYFTKNPVATMLGGVAINVLALYLFDRIAEYITKTFKTEEAK